MKRAQSTTARLNEATVRVQTIVDSVTAVQNLNVHFTRVSDLVWRVDAGTLLAAIEAGRSVPEIREFLAARSGTPLPDTVGRLLEDVADRAGTVRSSTFVMCRRYRPRRLTGRSSAPRSTTTPPLITRSMCEAFRTFGVY